MPTMTKLSPEAYLIVLPSTSGSDEDPKELRLVDMEYDTDQLLAWSDASDDPTGEHFGWLASAAARFHKLPLYDVPNRIYQRSDGRIVSMSALAIKNLTREL